MTEVLDIREQVDRVLARNPMPWYVGQRNSTRSMYPIRDGNHHVVAYAYNHEIAELIAQLIKDAP